MTRLGGSNTTEHGAMLGRCARVTCSASKHMRILAWTMLAAAMPATAEGGPSGTRYLIVRYDDYAPRSQSARVSRGIELETKLLALFERHTAKIVVGVVPFPVTDPAEGESSPVSTRIRECWLLTPENPWRELLRRYVSRGVVEPALHGIEHRRRSPPGHRPGEFRGQSYHWQHDAIRQGRDQLTAAVGIPVHTFIPPWNAWDTNTILALEDLGFQWCSADLHHSDSGSAGVRHLPQCSGEPKEVLDLLRSDHEMPTGSIIVLVTHPFDFEGDRGEEYFRSLRELLKFVKGDPDWRCVGLSDLPETSSAEWHRRFRRAVAWNHTQRFLQDSWGPPLVFGLQPIIFRPAEWYAVHTLPFQIAVAFTLLVSAALAWLASLAVARRARRSRLHVLAAILAGAALVVLMLGAMDISNRGYLIRGIRWQAIFVAAGVTLALWKSQARRAEMGGERAPASQRAVRHDYDECRAEC